MLDCKRHRDRLYTHNIHHQAFHSTPLSPHICPRRQDQNVLDNSRCHTFQLPLLSRQPTRRDLAMRPEKQTVDAYRTWPLHQQRGDLCGRRRHQRGVRLYNIAPAHCRSLALAHVHTKKDGRLCSLCDRTLVSLPPFRKGNAKS